jgi:hypothetical protein
MLRCNNCDANLLSKSLPEYDSYGEFQRPIFVANLLQNTLDLSEFFMECGGGLGGRCPEKATSHGARLAQ